MKNNPYIGPRPFERSDRDQFFGRTRETRDLLSLIMAERVVLFYAQSGAGKTSLLNTQIVPGAGRGRLQRAADGARGQRLSARVDGSVGQEYLCLQRVDGLLAGTAGRDAASCCRAND